MWLVSALFILVVPLLDSTIQFFGRGERHRREDGAQENGNALRAYTRNCWSKISC